MFSSHVEDVAATVGPGQLPQWPFKGLSRCERLWRCEAREQTDACVIPILDRSAGPRVVRMKPQEMEKGPVIKTVVDENWIETADDLRGLAALTRKD